MDTGATDEQQALLEVSTRFMEDACPLRAVRDGAWRDGAVMASYRRQAADLGWYSMLVPESLGGGSVSDNGVLDAALIASGRGGAVAAGVVRRHERRRPRVGARRQRRGTRCRAPDPGVRRGLGVVGRRRTRRRRTARRWRARRRDGRRWTRPDGRQDRRPGRRADILAAGDVRHAGRSDAGADRGRRAGRHGHGARRTRHHAPFSEVRFDAARVDPSAVVGAPGAADELLARQLAVAATLVAAESVGAMDHDFAMTVQYAHDRIAFGRPIGSFQGVKHQLADTSMALEMSKAITLAAARTVGSGDEYGPEAASMAKAFVGDAGIELVQTCFQVFGGIGYTWEHDQHLYLRRITTDAGLFGDPRVAPRAAVRAGRDLRGRR